MPALWSLIAIESGRQYGGNEGYADAPGLHYSYDSLVPNHKQLAAGDVVFIRDAKLVRGAARIGSIATKPSAKLQRRCPVCSVVNIRERISKHPPWRCSKCGAEFLNPAETIIDVVAFTANFGGSYLPAPAGIDAAVLKKAAVSPNDQFAIERLDATLLRPVMGSLFPAADDLFLALASASTLGPMEATPLDEQKPGYAPWEGDARESVLRAIRLRRGQQAFRARLLKAHNSRCVVSGCDLVDLLEAAHIAPYKGEKDHHVENGLLLRADLHTLFDLGLMGIDPATMRVWFSASARAAGYEALHGSFVTIGKTHPSDAALQLRWTAFTTSHGSAQPEVVATA